MTLLDLLSKNILNQSVYLSSVIILFTLFPFINMVTWWVQHPTDSRLFCSISTGPPISEIQLFQNLTLKIQGQITGWGQSSMSHSESNMLLNDIISVPCQSVPPFLRYRYFNTCPGKSNVNAMDQLIFITSGLSDINNDLIINTNWEGVKIQSWCRFVCEGHHAGKTYILDRQHRSKQTQTITQYECSRWHVLCIAPSRLYLPTA